MIYTIKSHPTKYKNTLFRSRLEARWAAFFDLAGWSWEYEPLDMLGWTPDFIVSFPCGHSECCGEHRLLVEVKPYFDRGNFDTHPCLNYRYSVDDGNGNRIADAGAGFGANPFVTIWEMCHGSGGGFFGVPDFVFNWRSLWDEAGNITRYKPAKLT